MAKFRGDKRKTIANGGWFKNSRAKWEPIFLETLARTCNVVYSCKMARVSHGALYELRHNDPEFEAKCQKAIDQAMIQLEGSMYKRAHRGVKKPVFQGGQHVGDVREYSDTLSIFLSKAHRPEKYRDNVQHSLDKNSVDAVGKVMSVLLLPGNKRNGGTK